MRSHVAAWVAAVVLSGLLPAGVDAQGEPGSVSRSPAGPPPVAHPAVHPRPPHVRSAPAAGAEATPGAVPNISVAGLPTFGGAWTSLGPRSIVSSFAPGKVSGRITSLATAPGSPAVVYAGASGGGVWKSTDSGAHWTPLTDDQPSLAIGSIAVDPNNANNVFAATGEANGSDAEPGQGIMRSTDAGAHWTTFGTATFTGGAAYVYQVVVDPANGAHVMAATQGGLYNSTDSGQTWTLNTSLTAAIPALPGKTARAFVNAIAPNPATAGQWFATVADNCYADSASLLMSSDNGANWDLWLSLAIGVPNAARVALAVGSGPTIYMVTADCSGNLARIIYTHGTTNNFFAVGAGFGGLTDFFQSGGNGQGAYDIGVAIDPTNSNHAIFLGVDLVATEDGGQTFKNIGNVYTNPYYALHPDQHAAVFYAADSFYIGNDGGAWRTTDMGGFANATPGQAGDYTNLNANLAITAYYYGTAVDLTHMIGGAQDNGTSGLVPSAGAPAPPGWQPLLGGDGGWTAMTSGSTIAYMEYQNLNLARIDYSTDTGAYVGPCSGASGTDPPCNENKSFISPFELDNSIGEIYAATTRLYRSATAGIHKGMIGYTSGATWQALGSANSLTVPDAFYGPYDYVYTMAMGSGTTHGTIVTGSAYGRVVRTTTAFGSFGQNDITGNLPESFFPTVQGLAVNPTNDAEVWVALTDYYGFADGVYHTTNAGCGTGCATWTRLGGPGFPAAGSTPAFSLAVDPTRPATIYVGRQNDILVCNTCGGASANPSWYTLGSGLPHAEVSAVNLTFDNANIVAWTHGRGAWALSKPSVGVPSAPTIGTAVGGNGQAAVTWTVPTSDGGLSITGYRMTSTPGGYTGTAAAGATSGTVTGLSNGTAYTFTVAASNSSGYGPESAASNSVTPQAALPGAPTGVSATGGNGQAIVTWSVPPANGSPITGYRVTPYVASSAQAPTTVGATTTATVTGLSNGTAYTFTVAAINGVGTGLDSAASNSVTPAGPPGTPTSVAASAGDSQATVTWSTPAANGSAITGYRVTPYIGAGAQTATTVGVVTSTVVTGLSNGTGYTFTVAAMNSVGFGSESTASSLITPAAAPGAPTAVIATAGNGQVSLAWTAPVSNGGAPITSYSVTPFIGTSAQTPVGTGSNGTTYTLTGLTNGTAYTFRVAAINSVGTGSLSSASNAATPATVPDAPSTVVATAGNAQVSLAWTAPVGNGGSAITSYSITPFIGAGAQSAIPTGSAAVGYTVTGLSNGTAYTFTVSAINSIGTGTASSASNSATPATVPGAPTAVIATAGNAQVSLTWTAPVSNGGSAIASYSVTPFVGTTAQTPVGTGSTGTTYTVTSLTNGTAYTFKVAATNSVGTGALSSATNAATPATVPGAPSAVMATAGDAQVSLTWTAPAGNGGAAITSYSITPFIGTAAQAVIPTGSAANGFTVTGLSNGTPYTFTVAATNSTGTGSASTPSGPVIPAAVTMVASLPALANSAYGGYTTRTYIQNRGSATAHVNVVYHDSLGHAVGLGDSNQSLAPNALWEIRQDNGNGLAPGQAGSAIVFSDQPLATFVNEFAPGSSDATSYTGVEIGVGTATSLSAPTIAKNAYGGYTTGIGLVNLGTGATDVTITYRNGDGSLAGVQNLSGVAAGAYQGVYTGDFATLPDGFAGSATITSSAGALAAIVNETGPGGQFSSYLTVPAGSANLLAPTLFRNAYGGYNTGLALVETQGVAGSGTITYTDAAGVQTVVAITIAAHGFLGIYQGGGALAPPADGPYTARIAFTGGTQVAGIVNEVAAGGTMSTSYNTFTAGTSSINLPLVENAAPDGLTTSVGIMNTGATPTTVTLRYFNPVTGALLGSAAAVTLQPGGTAAIYQGDASSGLAAGARASAAVTASGGGSIAVICNEVGAGVFMSYVGR